MGISCLPRDFAINACVGNQKEHLTERNTGELIQTSILFLKGSRDVRDLSDKKL